MTEIVDLKDERLKRELFGTPEQRARREAMESDVFETIGRHMPYCNRFSIIEVLALAIVTLRHDKGPSDDVSAADVLDLLDLFETERTGPNEDSDA
jgi:hypothetical protein